MTIRRASSFGVLLACGLLFQCSGANQVSVENRYGETLQSVVIKDKAGTACSLAQIAPGATASCTPQFRADGEVTYEITAGKLKKSGLLGFAKAGGAQSLTLTVEKNGSVATGATAVGFHSGMR